MKFYAAVMMSGVPNFPEGAFVKTKFVEITEEQHAEVLEIIHKNKKLGAGELEF